MVAALCAASACSGDSPSWWATAVEDSAPAMAAGCASEIRSKVTISGSAATPRDSAVGSGAASPSMRWEYAPGSRRTVWQALLTMMSSGPSAATSSVSETTWVGSRRSMPTILSRWIQSAESSIAAKRRTASWGKRVVIVVWAPSRSSRSAMYIPILARPPVSSARLPVRSVRWSRLAWLIAAQLGHSQW